MRGFEISVAMAHARVRKVVYPQSGMRRLEAVVNRAQALGVTDYKADQRSLPPAFAGDVDLTFGWNYGQILAQQTYLRKLHRIGKGKSTVPEGYRDKVSCVGYRNPVNSEEEIRHFVEILAVDVRGSALVEKVSHNSYTDAETEETVVMLLVDAIALIDAYRQEAGSYDVWADRFLEALWGDQ